MTDREDGMAVRMRIGDVAREQGLTIKALAERAGVAYNTAHALATGRATRIDLDTLDRMCAALEVSPGELFIRIPGATAAEDRHARRGFSPPGSGGGRDESV